MKPPVFDYLRPPTLEAALTTLKARGDQAKLLAGGQSLVPVLNLRLAAPDLLIDLNAIASLRELVHESDGALRVGAMTRHRTLERDDDVARSHPLIPVVADHIAHVQIRNRGTIGGSLCHADPAAEWPAVCLACDAEMTLASTSGQRVVPAAEFSLGVYTTALEPNEILTQIRFPAWPSGRRWGFLEVSRRRGDFAIVGVIVWLDLDTSEICRKARIVVFGAGDVASLASTATRSLIGKKVDTASITQAAHLARNEVEVRSDHHASAAYRSDLVQTLVKRTLRQAMGLQIRGES